jgi:hypothetical protein
MRSRARLRSLCALVGLTWLALGSSASATIIQTEVFEGRTYHLLAAKWWHESEDEAVSLGGHLVTINDLAEHNFVYDTFGETALANAPASGKVNLWIGLCDMTLDGSYQWCDGSAIDYMNFFSDQPQRNHSDETFMGIRVRGRNSSVPVGRWIDIVSDTRLGDLNFAVVEVTPVPEPAVWMLLASGAVCVVWWNNLRRNRRSLAVCPVVRRRR